MDTFGARRRAGEAGQDTTVVGRTAGDAQRRNAASGRAAARAGRKAGDKIQRGVLTVSIVLLVSMVAVAVALTAATHNGGAGVTAFVLFAAASAVGAGLGFLFGLPRARVSDLAGDGTGPDATPAPPTKASTYYLTNSNLIKVSDWLTTIVIGLGLVNLGNIQPAVRRLGHALQAPLGNAAYSGAIGVSVLVVGVLAGFILDYLWTSIRVRELLEEAERQNQQHVPELRNRTVAEAREQAGAKELKLVVPPGTPDDATVVEQTLPPGTPVPRGTGLTVTMAPPAGSQSVGPQSVGPQSVGPQPGPEHLDQPADVASPVGAAPDSPAPALIATPVEPAPEGDEPADARVPADGDATQVLRRPGDRL